MRRGATGVDSRFLAWPADAPLLAVLVVVFTIVGARGCGGDVRGCPGNAADDELTCVETAAVGDGGWDGGCREVQGGSIPFSPCFSASSSSLPSSSSPNS